MNTALQKRKDIGNTEVNVHHLPIGIAHHTAHQSIIKHNSRTNKKEQKYKRIVHKNPNDYAMLVQIIFMASQHKYTIYNYMKSRLGRLNSHAIHSYIMLKYSYIHSIIYELFTNVSTVDTETLSCTQKTHNVYNISKKQVTHVISVHICFMNNNIVYYSILFLTQN